ncbi:UDP-N-acetylmuramate dehydrogenase [Parashewanella curva]|uniref:UDP-N-acetylenolpyruvoylglucosamine reductase n=1 Tax=Parashewanella curva TaxID=2338552 RepID=A0A3L8PVT6_9GAMM|nr:UDP-N-acetylmuramate dehydrogenase [Parashewanella curva]RLV59451.1 UDP-N-acetylmuramate dehydrogenase [Parashewanella curva]
MTSSQISLLPYNTLGLNQSCTELLTITSEAELKKQLTKLSTKPSPWFVLGGGSNLVLCEDFNGVVLKMELKGIVHTEDDRFHYLSIAAGEDWHQLVEYCLEHEIDGLENLALIPGTVGAAPIQNIGAYGVEFCELCDWVEFMDATTQLVTRLTAEECQFGYRDSIFKQELKGKVVITQVGFKLSKNWQPVLNYGPLQQLEHNTVTSRDIFDLVCQVRQQKLPDPKMLGNVGSFFKNPIVSVERFQSLHASFPDIAAYPHNDDMKLAAGWLIDKAGLKGYQLGQAAVHNNQALVLVNYGQAKGEDIITLARYIIEQIKQIFGVELEPEPRLIGQHGEITING